MSSQAMKVRLQITRAGITTSPGAAEYLTKGLRFAPRAWGFPDGSVLVFRGDPPRWGDEDRTAQQISRRRWAAYNPD